MLTVVDDMFLSTMEEGRVRVSVRSSHRNLIRFGCWCIHCNTLRASSKSAQNILPKINFGNKYKKTLPPTAYKTTTWASHVSHKPNSPQSRAQLTSTPQALWARAHTFRPTKLRSLIHSQGPAQLPILQTLIPTSPQPRCI